MVYIKKLASILSMIRIARHYKEGASQPLQERRSLSDFLEATETIVLGTKAF